MYQETERTRRVGELLRRGLADVLLREMDSRELKLISITDVSMSRDLRHAIVYVTSLAKDDANEEVKTLNEIKGFLRKQLSRRVQLKHLPSLKFELDESISRGIRLSSLIESVNKHEDE
ncbi:MAG: ribosome-binding factor A [Parasphingorhabdus sp.]|jgi:ribosome-binding factor A